VVIKLDRLGRSLEHARVLTDLGEALRRAGYARDERAAAFRRGPRCPSKPT
jgi:hypothetical protein